MLLLAVLCASLVVCGGCRASGPLPETRPTDFALHVLVSGPFAAGTGSETSVVRERATDSGAALPAGLRPASYIAEPDGRLRAHFGSGAAEAGLPPIARLLSPEERSELYALALASGVLDDASRRIGSIGDARTLGTDSRIASIETVAGGEVVTVAVDASDTGSVVYPLLARLAELTWQR
ncbi:MAG: hypothetical protein AAF235_02525 [Planctomycetota bacterium]